MLRAGSIATVLTLAVVLGVCGCPNGFGPFGDANSPFGDPNWGWDPFGDPNFWIFPTDPNELVEPNQPTADAGATKLFDQVWQDFDETYSYFELKGIDWDAIKSQYRAQFEADLSASQFATKIATVLAELRDLHVRVQKADGSYVEVYTREAERNYTSAPRNRYRTNEYTALGEDVLWHAWYEQNIAYIRVDTFDSDAFSGISDAQIEQVFTTYANAGGMIFDIRGNNGGDERIAAKFVSHFTDQARVYGYTRTRNGPAHDDFGPLESKTLQPADAGRFSGPVACLIGQRCISSAEWCALMARVCPNVTLIGDRTRGSSGNPKGFSLPNGVKYTVPTWIAYTDEQVEIEDQGIAPDFAIAAAQSIDDSHDYVIEKAIEELTK